MTEPLIAGVDFSGAKKEPNDTWIATGRLTNWQFQIVGVHKVGSRLLSAELNKMNAVAIGIDCPFSLPVDFIEFLAQKALRKNFQSWQEVAEHLVFISAEDFMALVVEFKKEPKRVTDKATTGALSPLHRGNPSMVQMTYEGMRMLAQLDPKKFAVLPFQDQIKDGCSVLEVYPRQFLRFLELPDTGYKNKLKHDDAAAKVRNSILGGLIDLRERKGISLKEITRLSVPNDIRSKVIASDHALDAIISAYITAIFVSAPQLLTDPFSADDLNVLLEGWIYSTKN